MEKFSSVDGIPTSSWNRFSELVDDETAHSVVVRKYGGGLENKEITVFELPKKEKAVRGFFGVGPELRYMNLNPIEATSSALDRFAEVSVLSVKGLINFFSPKGISGFVDSTFGQDSPENVASSSIPSGEDDERLLSIYGAARLGSSMLQESTHSYIWFLVLINVFVGIFNLVPLLPLDGGHAAIATYERIRSRGEKRYVADVSKLIPLTWAVITILVSIALIALYRDIVDLPNFG